MAASHAFWEALKFETRQLLLPIVSPLIKIIPLTGNFEISGSVIFSSVNGVLNGPAGDGSIAYCVGAMTTQAALTAGWSAIQAGETANQLVSNLLNRNVDVSLTHLSGFHTRGNIAEILSAAGVNTKRIVVYDQENCALTSQATEALTVNFPLLVPLFSPRTAHNFAGQHNGQAGLHIIALSQDVADQVSDLTLETLTLLDHPTRLAMIDKTQKVASALTLG